MAQIVFDSPTIRARHVPGRAGVLVVTFFSRASDVGLDHPGFGEGFLKRRALAAIHVSTSANHYWQTADLWPAMRAIRAFAGRERLVAYGSSMGAYGALLCSGALAADTVIALSPIYSVDPAKVPFDGRRRVDDQSFPNDDLGKRISRSARHFIFYDPLTQDRRHVRLIHGLNAPSTLVPLPFAGHPCTGFLRDIGELSRIVPQLIKHGHFDVTRWRADLRAARRRSAAYWRAMSQAARRHKHFPLAVESAKRALAVSSSVLDSAQSLTSLGTALGHARRHQEAIEALRNVVASHPRHARAHAALAATYRNIGNVEAALRHVSEAILLDPGNHAFEKLKATIVQHAPSAGPDYGGDSTAATIST